MLYLTRVPIYESEIFVKTHFDQEPIWGYLDACNGRAIFD